MQNQREPKKGWKKINVWAIKGPVIVLAVLLTILSEWLNWGRAPIVASVAMIVPILGFRDYWNEFKFWITIVLLGLLQIPLVVAVGPSMERFKLPFMLVFAILDAGAMIVIISRVLSVDLGEHK